MTTMFQDLLTKKIEERYQNDCREFLEILETRKRILEEIQS
jgi:hypothetical protein